ncbi:uncharacterized protein LOC132800756 [Ziziphus jujuba]|uniref:Uncharacterized protein LOC132800756 n=1 Tax=Ziziphus jujuba TaxID=326968 RepID=A0ABM4A2Q2_ZIZJJ|nr:uncharacterized protein LOC132800756 [Ziziphus jujuba]
MKENELVKDFRDRLLKVANQIRVLREPLTDQRIVEKVLVSLLEKFEAKISSLEKSRNLSEITLSELINALKAIKQRRAIRKKESLESTFISSRSKKNNKRLTTRTKEELVMEVSKTTTKISITTTMQGNNKEDNDKTMEVIHHAPIARSMDMH